MLIKYKVGGMDTTEKLAIAGAGVVVLAGATYYLISQSKTTQPTPPSPTPSPSPSVIPEISATNTNFELSQTPLGYTYSPTSFIVYGSGFTPNGTVIVSDNYSGTIYSGTADSSGKFSGTIQLSSFSPQPGSSTITGVDLTTGLNSSPITLTFTLSTSVSPSVSPILNATNTNFTLTPGLLGYTYSPPSFIVYGSGFIPNGTVIVSDNYSGTLYTTTADSSGKFSGTIQLSNFNPQPGSSTITGIDLTTGLNSSPITLTFTLSGSPSPQTSASLSVSPSTTNYSSGGTLTFTGSGFAHNSTVTFSVNYLTPLPATTTTDSNGNFSIKFNYPGGGVLDSIMSQITGNITMTAVDNSNNSASATWYNYA